MFHYLQFAPAGDLSPRDVCEAFCVKINSVGWWSPLDNSFPFYNALEYIYDLLIPKCFVSFGVIKQCWAHTHLCFNLDFFSLSL